MKSTTKILMAATGILLFAGYAFSQGEKEGHGQVVVTILPKQGEDAANVTARDARVKINGKQSTITSLVPARGEKSALELVVLLDSSSRSSLGNQLDDLGKFIKALPPNVRVAVAYMQSGQAVFTAPLSTDHAQVAQQLRLPGGSAGSNASPYFCLSDLAKRWPGNDPDVRREVLMVTDGVDPYNLRFDPDNPYMRSAINDAARARIVVYAIYFRGQGRLSNTQYENNAGQNLLMQVTDATGGKSFWIGSGNPISFGPYLDELNRRLNHQYELRFTIPTNGKSSVEGMKLSLKVPGAEVSAPQQVFLVHSAATQD